MALADTAKLIASLELKDQFTPGATKVLRSVDKLDAGISSMGSRSYKAGQQIGTGIRNAAFIAAGAIGFLATNVGLGLKSLSELESITTQTNAVLKSTKGVSGETADSIRNLAEKYENLNAIIDDKVIQSAENVLLTFTAIRKDAFEPALTAALDMSTALGTDLQGSVIQIGKALQDPIKGITALRRVGVNFSQDQVTVIKRLVETGHSLDAQKLILKELNTEFGGSFIAQGDTTAGKVAKFKDAIEDLQKTLATALLPVIGKVADGLSKFLADPAVIRGVKDLGDGIAGLFSDKNLAAGADFLKGAFETAKSAAPIVQSAAKATFGFIQAAVGVFKTLPPELQGLLAGGFALNKITGGLVTNVAGGLFDTIKDLVIKQRGATPLNPLFVADVTAGAGALAGVAGAAGVAEGAAAAAGGLGAVTIGAGLAAGTAISALGIMGLGWLITATSSPEQMAVTAQNVIDSNRRKRTFGAPAPENVRVGAPSGESSDARGMAQATTNLARVLPTFAGKLKDDIVDLGQLQKASNQFLADQFRQAVAGLKTATKPADVAKAVASALDIVIKKGRGDADATRGVLADLKAQLRNAPDKATATLLRDAIKKVESKIPGREYAQAQIRQADKLLADGKVSKSDIAKIKGIEQALKDRGLPHAADTIQSKVVAAVEQAKKDQAAATRATTEAIKDKDMSPKVSVTVPITNRLTFSTREIIDSSVSFGRAFVTASGAPKPS